MCATGWFDWIHALRVEHRMVLSNNETLLCVHATPGYTDGPGIRPHTSDEELAKLTAGCQADIVRVVDGVTVINPGPVSNPLAPDLRASYAILEADHHHVRVVHRRVEYDHRAVIEAVQRSHHPAARFIIDHQRGNRTVEGMMASATARRHMIQLT